MGLQILLVNFTLIHLILNEMALGHGWGKTQLFFKICLEYTCYFPNIQNVTNETEKQNQSKIQQNLTKFHHIPVDVLSLQCLPPKMPYSLMLYSLAGWPLAIQCRETVTKRLNIILQKNWKHKYCKRCRSAEFKRAPQSSLTPSAVGSFLSWKCFHQNPSYR